MTLFIAIHGGKKMFRKKTSKVIDTVNGCIITTPSEHTADFPFCDEVIKLNTENQMGFERNDNNSIRIDGIIATNKKSLYQMLDALTYIAEREGRKSLWFADVLSVDVSAMLRAYGFVGDKPPEANTNCYLKYVV